MPSLAQHSGLTRDAAPAGAARTGVSLLFPAGARPAAADVCRRLRAPESGVAARVAHDAHVAEGWLELLASGLTFELRSVGLRGGAVAPALHEHRYGFLGSDPFGDVEMMELIPSGHIAAGAGLQPVVRTMAGLAASLALELSACAVGWSAAGTLMEPRYFSRVVLGWLGGGAFPALGLTALIPGEDGGVVSHGLSHFIGREMRLEPRAGESRADAVKVAIRVIDELVRQGPPAGPCTIAAGAESLVAEPSQVGNVIWVWREAG